MKINGTPDGGGKSAVIEGLTITSNGTYTAGAGVDGYSPVEVDVPISGWDQKSFTEEIITFINIDNSASFVVSSAFKNNTTIQTVNLPYATSVGSYAFYNCSSLSQVNLPVCTYISNFAFHYCSSLSQVDLPMCSYIGHAVFYSNNQLTQVNLPECVSLSTSAFAECVRLQTISLPKCEYIGNKCFEGAFQSNTTGYDININLPVCSYIGSSAFYWTQRSLTLTLGYDGVVDLPNGSYTFNKTSVISIYVPASLVDVYKSAQNWSYFSTQIFPISE